MQRGQELRSIDTEMRFVHMKVTLVLVVFRITINLAAPDLLGTFNNEKFVDRICRAERKIYPSTHSWYQHYF